MSIDWDQIPEVQFQGYLRRLQIVELILDDSIDMLSRKKLRAEFLEDNGVSERTVHNWLARYRKQGPSGLLFDRRQRSCSLRIQDATLRSRVLELVRESPGRSVAGLRRLLKHDAEYAGLIATVSDRTLYRFLAENALGAAARRAMLHQATARAYHRFEAPHSLALVQGDARDGIWLDLPDGRRAKTYLFLWIDDFSRKILFGKYYLDEKLPCLEDSFKYMILRWGIPLAVYLDNGKVYLSRQFRSVLAELRIKELHHKPYQAHAKGKVEAMQKIIKNQFQSEAARAGMRTLEELNSAFWAWAELEYNTRIHSATGQAPEERFQQGLPKDHRRVEELAAFQAMFLWKALRTVSKWGKISLHGNLYPVSTRPPKSIVQVRYDPFDLSQVLIYEPAGGTRLETSSATTQRTTHAPSVPQESPKSPVEVSRQSIAYFTRLRESYLAAQKAASQLSFDSLRHKPTEEDPHA